MSQSGFPRTKNRSFVSQIRSEPPAASGSAPISFCDGTVGASQGFWSSVSRFLQLGALGLNGVSPI